MKRSGGFEVGGAQKVADNSQTATNTKANQQTTASSKVVRSFKEVEGGYYDRFGFYFLPSGGKYKISFYLWEAWFIWTENWLPKPFRRNMMLQIVNPYN